MYSVYGYIECERVAKKSLAKVSSSSSSSSASTANITGTTQPTSEVTVAAPVSSSEPGMKLYALKHAYIHITHTHTHTHTQSHSHTHTHIHTHTHTYIHTKFVIYNVFILP